MATDQPARKPRVFPVFRSSFVLTDRHAHDLAVAICRAWIFEKCAQELPFPDDEGGDFRAPDCQVSVRTLTHEDGRIWAARLEDLREAADGRNWTTDLFVESQGRSLVRFGAELLLRATGSGDARFRHSRPRVVREILARLSAEADGVPIADKADVVSDSGVDPFIQLLLKDSRRLPVVAISRDEAHATEIDPDLAASRLAGAAHVRIIESGASWELTRRLGKHWSVYNRAVRVYFPGVEVEEDDPYRHPLSLAGPAGSSDRLLDWLCATLLPSGFRDADEDARFWRVGLLRQVVAPVPPAGGDASAAAETIESLHALLDEARRDVETAEGLMEEADRRREAAERERDRLKFELDSLRDSLQALPSGMARSGVGPQDVLPLVKGNLTVAHALNFVARLFPDRLSVLPSAHASAKQSAGFRFPEQALDLLWTLATDYWAMLASGAGDWEARKVFGNAYAPKEAETLSTSGRKNRTFNWNGEDLFMERHLKIGVKDSAATTLRIHFHWSASEKRIIIGHCGPHIPF